MAKSRIKGITVEIGGDVTGLDKALSKVNSNIINTQSQLKDVERLLKLDPTNTELLAQKQRLLGDAVASVTEKLGSLRQAAQNATVDDAAAEEYAKMAAQVSRAEASLKKLKEQQKRLADKGEIDTDEYKSLQQKIEASTKKLEELKKKAADTYEELGRPISQSQYDALQREIAATEQQLRTLENTADDAGDAVEEIGKQGSIFKDVFMADIAAKSVEAFAAAMKKGAEAAASLVKSSIAAYAAYEQLIGGVETLFGDSSDEIEKYAREAYKTAGLSANEYMETVTSFSASLLQSLGGDTEAAAKVSDRAITDMADNANKMGTAMESIQNAYQGFAKQNYTMLDNLKLGYGGTKEEMERLIADAAKLTDVQKELGITVDANDMSFANIVNAISVTQKQMGIMGTTSKEASSTIEGSTNSMKAAWSNLLTGMADDEAGMEQLMDDFVESVITVGDNVIPRIETTIDGITAFIDKSASALIPKVVDTLIDHLPDMIEAGVTLAKALLSALFDPDNIYKTTYAAIDTVLSICENLGDSISSPEGIAAIESFVTAFVGAIWDAIKLHFSKRFNKFTDEVSEEYGISALFDTIKNSDSGSASLRSGGNSSSQHTGFSGSSGSVDQAVSNTVNIYPQSIDNATMDYIFDRVNSGLGAMA